MSLEASSEQLISCWRLVTKPPRLASLPILHPYEITLVNQKRDDYLGLVRASLRDGTYRPSAAPVADVPKGNGGIRPVHILTLRDRIVYAFLGLVCLPNIKAELGADHRYIDFSYRLYDPIKPDDWFQPYFRPWREYVQSSIRLIDDGATVVAETDISGFYENIDYEILFSELTRIAVSKQIQELLRRCLKTWLPSKRGLPQSHPTSHLLAKFYLSSVDRHLVALTPYVHRRFSDDTRFFCRSKVEGKLALQEFIARLRDKTLNIQSAKTRLMDAKEAREEFLGATPLIESILKEYRAARVAEFTSLVFSSEYMSVAEVIEASREENIPPEVLWRAYDEFVLGRRGGDFKKSVFHFLLGQLGKIRDRYAIEDCLGRFVDQPQETENILQYLSEVNLTASEDATLLDFLELKDNIYAFQTSQCFQYFRMRGTHDPGRLRSIARRFAFTPATPPYLKSEARALLALYGSATDFDALLGAYPEARNPLECAELVCTLGKVELGRRNGFLGTVSGSDWLIDRAADAVRAGIIPIESIQPENFSGSAQ